jgi:hypothetical protein
LALKHGSSSGVDCVDVKFVLAAFQEINSCRLVVQLTIEGSAARPDLVMEVTAREKADAPAGPAHLGSVRLSVGSTEPRTMEAAMLQALYAVDAQLAEKEFARGIDKKRSIPAKA